MKLKGRLTESMEDWRAFLAYGGERPLLQALRGAKRLRDLQEITRCYFPQVVRVGVASLRSRIPQRNDLERAFVAMRAEVIEKLDDCVFPFLDHKIRTCPVEMEDWITLYASRIGHVGFYSMTRERSLLDYTLGGHFTHFYRKGEEGRVLYRNSTFCGSLETHFPLFRTDTLTCMPVICQEEVRMKVNLYRCSGTGRLLPFYEDFQEINGASWQPLYASLRDFLGDKHDYWFRQFNWEKEIPNAFPYIVNPEEHDLDSFVKELQSNGY